MELTVERVDVWAAEIEDLPGGLASVLASLRDAGADLEFLVARRNPEKGKGTVFVAPLLGDDQIRAAAQVGFNVAQSLHSVRISGQDRRGVAAELTSRLAEAGLNLRGFTASASNGKFVAYAGVDSLSDAHRAIDCLKRA
ncbi:MAG: ACT domain-containing protein [Rhodocyclaceae bacterium]|nr:ACT domain-containing protein [Rhodocyclaceae bacterium]